MHPVTSLHAHLGLTMFSLDPDRRGGKNAFSPPPLRPGSRLNNAQFGTINQKHDKLYQREKMNNDQFKLKYYVQSMSHFKCVPYDLAKYSV